MNKATTFIIAIGALTVALIVAKGRKAASGTGAGAGEGPAGTLSPADPEAAFRDALQAVRSKYGDAVAANVERIYRLETGNFKSQQFKLTNTPGMHALSDAFPFGWSLASAGFSPADFLPPITMDENAGGTFKWVRFRSFPAAVSYLGYYLNKYNNNAARWNGGGDPDYTRKLAAMGTPTLNGLT